MIGWRRGDPGMPGPSSDGYWGDMYLNPLAPPALTKHAARLPEPPPAALPTLRVVQAQGSARSFVVYTTGTDGHVTVSLYDMQGSLVCELVDRVVPQGTHTIAWDGRSTTGSRLPPGQYVLRMRSSTETVTTTFSAAPHD